MSLQVYSRILVHDKKGRLKRRTRFRKSHSFVLQFLQHLQVFMEHADGGTGNTLTGITDTGGTDRTLRATTYDLMDYLAALAPDDTATYGIVVGDDDTAEANDDVALGNKIAHGTGADQLDYGAHSVTDTQEVGSNVDTVWNRSFYNGSGGTVTVKEIGIYVRSVDTGGTTRTFCILRDVLASSVDVDDTETLTVQYTFRTTV